MSVAEARKLADHLRRAAREASRTGGTFWAGLPEPEHRLEIGVSYRWGVQGPEDDDHAA